jgi:hypothetical protein
MAGVVGHHLAEADVRAMAAEIARVLTPTGWVVLDAGPAMPRACLQGILATYGFAVRETLRAVPCVSHHVLVFQRGSTLTREYFRKETCPSVSDAAFRSPAPDKFQRVDRASGR